MHGACTSVFIHTCSDLGDLSLADNSKPCCAQDGPASCKEAAGALLAFWSDPRTHTVSGAVSFDAWAILIRTGRSPAGLAPPQMPLFLAKVCCELGVWLSVHDAVISAY